jgi:hypothetical protein
MKTIEMHQLKPGDIFTHEYKLHNREAFLVNSIDEKHVICTSRKTRDEKGNFKEVKKAIKGNVIWLRKDDGN